MSNPITHTLRALSCALTATAALCLTACNDNTQDTQQPQNKAHVRLVCSTGVQVATPSTLMAHSATRATLTANGKPLTDIYVLDYNKTTGKLLNVLHQTATTTDFAEPDLLLDYGEHIIKVVATRSAMPSLLTASLTDYPTTANVMTEATDDAPIYVTANKTSDTFAGSVDITVGTGTATTAQVILDRMVAGLTVKMTDNFPADCSTFDVALNEYPCLALTDYSVIDAAINHRATDISALAGTTGATVTYYVLCPSDGYTTDITVTMGSTTGTSYPSVSVPTVPLERNKMTTITGTFYGHQQGFSISLRDTWDEAGHDINL